MGKNKSKLPLTKNSSINNWQKKTVGESILSEKNILEICPETSIKIDCFQNLLLTLIKNKNTNPCIFGSVWPWFFYRKENTEIILYQYFVSEKSIKELSGHQLIESNIQGNVIENLGDNLKRNPIIINVDQYYVKHHYPYVYQKVHGIHSLLLLDYDLKKSQFLAIGAFPTFKGWIDANEIAQGIISISKISNTQKKYYWLQSLDNWKQPTKDDIKNRFISSLNAHENYFGFEVIEINDIADMFIRMHENGRDSFLHLFEKISNERWFWEIERPGNLLISYIESDVYSPISSLSEKKEVISIIKEVNSLLVLSLRKIYKYQLSNNTSSFSDGVEMLKISANKSEILKRRLIQYT